MQWCSHPNVCEPRAAELFDPVTGQQACTIDAEISECMLGPDVGSAVAPGDNGELGKKIRQWESLAKPKVGGQARPSRSTQGLSTQGPSVSGAFGPAAAKGLPPRWGDPAKPLPLSAGSGDNAIPKTPEDRLPDALRFLRSMESKKPGAETVKRTVSYMREFRAIAQVQRCGCLALAAVAAHSPADRPAIATAGGIEAVAAAMRAHSRDAEVQKTGCRALISFTDVSPENRKRSVAAGGLDAAADVMVFFDKDDDLRATAGYALRCLASGSPENRARVEHAVIARRLDVGVLGPASSGASPAPAG